MRVRQGGIRMDGVPITVPFSPPFLVYVRTRRHVEHNLGEKITPAIFLTAAESHLAFFVRTIFHQDALKAKVIRNRTVFFPLSFCRKMNSDSIKWNYPSLQYGNVALLNMSFSFGSLSPKT